MDFVYPAHPIAMSLAVPTAVYVSLYDIDYCKHLVDVSETR